MSIWRKLLYFGIGIFLGVLMVKFLFGGRDIQCSYFPNDRVLYDLRGKKERIITPAAQAQLNAYSLDTSLITDLLYTGKVNFKKSNTEADSCNTYWIDFKQENKPNFSVNFMNCDSSAILIEVVKGNEK